MQILLTLGKYSTLGFWVLPFLALFGFFGGDWNHNILWIGVIIFFAHIGELVVIQGKLKMNDHDTIHDGLMVILVGFFHWLPIIKKPDMSANSDSVDQG
jgi:uncharacterized protein YhhL (DUF1145 family)